MTYTVLINSYIESSGLSLAEIAKRMSEIGVKVDRSYLSKLKNGKADYPAAPYVNRAIARITGGDSDALVITAFYELAPKEVKNDRAECAELASSLASLIAWHNREVTRLNNEIRELEGKCSESA